ncbi:hypothetical protein MANES_13G046600v8 [Manihot esculenta]|uniref:Uncharacterized protein n=1 Tax=Manihot esculenta TaxID=3983 RepID=A0ACB7GKA6_MANES|nr:hypothetical protein MANES_13G046600v8 [Manihot esculenta]
MESCPDLYPLTSLQIGDIKSYLSRAFLYFAPTSHKFLILVDNQSWWKSKHSKTNRLREFVITKYRVSPFKNNRALQRWPSLAYKSSSQEKKKFFNWLPDVSMASVSEKTPFSMMNLYKALHGFLVFEVAWKDVRGINYLNELQTDTSLALEVKALRKWEFSGIDQALSCISLWFSSTQTEAQTLWSSLVFLYYKVPSSSKGIKIASKELLFNASQAALFSEDVFFDVRECPIETNDKSCMNNQVEESMHGKRKENLWEDGNLEPMEYKDAFLLLGFNDRNLPFKLNQIITSDLRLLTLLEAGLPSWVIFLQSYPFFNRVYRPWMRPVFRILYAVISSITVIIGFYDLYKNVPLLKAAASHLSWPIFKWIESCDMISRIWYLGTMLFLHTFEKAVRLFLMKTQVMKLPVLVLARLLIHPLERLIGFLLPVWSIFTGIGDKICMIAEVVIQPLSSMLLVFAEVLFSPLELLYSFILNLGTLISSLFDIVWELLAIPSHGCLHLAKYMSSILLDIYEVLSRILVIFTNKKGLVLRVVQVKPSSFDMSFWHLLWNDLLSKVCLIACML